MREFKASTKQGQNILNRALYYEGYSLSDVYGSYSAEKGRSWKECKEQCDKENGTNFHICSHNTFSYCVAWNGNDEIMGDYIRIETSRNSYKVWLEM